jgi:hypothetical protein
MALTVKCLADGQLGTAAQGMLYTVPAGKAAVVKTQRFVNRDTSARTMNLYYLRSGGTARMILPNNLSIAAGGLAITAEELTMGALDQIQGDASLANKIDYVISGLERDA